MVILCINRMRSTRENVQYESDTSSVKVKMCIMNQAHHQCKQGCEVQANRSSSFGTGRTTRCKNQLIMKYQRKFLVSNICHIDSLFTLGNFAIVSVCFISLSRNIDDNWHK